ncbi:hypothetical protein M426DRAFT_195103 [Hypoxylon sp. CI-4A]|nr:hypothetical protein M426DRAFT_195103 [Hypoxylon sp. CI-4A]
MYECYQVDMKANELELKKMVPRNRVQFGEGLCATSTLDDYPEDPDVTCEYSSATGTVAHGEFCSVLMCNASDYSCYTAKLSNAERELSRFPLQFALEKIFRNPSIAGIHHLLDEKMFMVERDILAKLHRMHCPELYELEFHGLLIQEGWGISPGELYSRITGPVMTTILDKFWQLLLVFVGYLLWR